MTWALSTVTYQAEQYMKNWFILEQQELRNNHYKTEWWGCSMEYWANSVREKLEQQGEELVYFWRLMAFHPETPTKQYDIYLTKTDLENMQSVHAWLRPKVKVGWATIRDHFALREEWWQYIQEAA